MPIFIASLLGGLVQAAGSIAGRVMLALGFGFITYQGLDVLLGWIQTQVFSQLANLPPTVIQLLGILQVGTAINIVFSAIAARLLLNGLTSGTIKRMVAK
jgi:hypothetical protein